MNRRPPWVVVAAGWLLCLASPIASAIDLPADESRAFRTWSLSSGETVEAKLLKTRGADVLLEEKTGKRRRMSRRMLSEDDRRHVESLLHAASESAAADRKLATMPFDAKSDVYQSLVLWLDAGDPATLDVVGGRVAKWRDKGPKGFDATQTNVAQQPAFVEQAFAGRPMLRFQGGGNWMFTECVPALGKSSRTLVVVVAHVAKVPGLLSHMLHYGSPTPEQAYGITSQGWRSENWGNHYWHGSLNSGLPTNSGGGYIVVASFADGTDAFTVNGGQTSAHNQPWPQGALDTGASGNVHGLVIGGRITGGEGAAADMGEVMAFSSALEPEDRMRLEGYLAHKWKMVDLLPDSHPFKKKPQTAEKPTVGGRP